MQTGCQIYVKGSVEAVAFYQRAFNWTIGINFKNSDGTYEHVSLMFGERDMLAVAEDSIVMSRSEIQDGKWPIMSFDCWGLGTREAVDQAYHVLSEGAHTTENPNGPAPVPWNEYCFNLVDKFGVYWWVAI
ncbi:MAG: hypothetical protein FWC47_01655 [Oscillospiraceae bacterium]|nr:hypothetical protein [Oscillospiraceae bacterium]